MVLLCVGAAAVGWFAATAAAQSGSYPPCPPTTPALPAPGVTPQGPARDAPTRIIAGRPFTLDYDESVVVVQETVSATPGTTLEGGALGDLPTVVVPTPGPAAFTVSYIDVNSTRTNACTWSAGFTVNVEAGDPVAGRMGAIEGPEPRWPRAGPPALPRKGFLSAGRPLVGALWTCSGTTGRIPVVAELFVERRLARRPTELSPAGRLTVDDPCGTQSVSAARAPGALLRFYGGPDADGGERDLTAVVSYRKGARYWLRVTQAGRLIGQARFFAAWQRQQGAYPPIWVIAPQAAYEAARCARPRRGFGGPPLGFRKWPIPPCPGRGGSP
jgi:hypothetical protein